MPHDIQKLEAAIAALQSQRAALGDALVDAALAPLIAQRSAQRRAAQQLRLVSVLFLDIVSSTGLTQRLDPEDVHEVMDGALERFAAVVQTHGGSVLQFAGDSLLAAFGDVSASEDDAERAVRAGLALLDAGRAEAARVQRRHGPTDFGVRVGVHTGKVLLGGGVDEEGTIRGMTVNVAARMEQTAPPGALRISHDTWRHIQGLFDVQAQPPLAVKGLDQPIATYLVQGARPLGQARASRGIEGVSTPLFGRSAELAQLLAAFDEAHTSRQARAFTVLAEAGLGKSRLMDELLHSMDARASGTGAAPRLQARAHAAASGQPYRLLRDMLATHLRIADGDSGDAARLRFVEGLAPYFAAQGAAPVHLLGQLIGLDFASSEHLVAVDPRQLRDRALAALRELFQALAAEHGGTLLVIADDLHWADDASLDLLLQLAGAPVPLLLVAVARPALLERRPGWFDGVSGHRTLVLDALGRADCEALAASLLQRLDDVPAALTRLLTQQSAGNPYYMEELLKMLIDDGVICVDGPRWQLQPGRLADVRVPGTLTGVLQARLDALAPGERLALQMASIVGSVFWDDALAALDDDAPAALPELQRKALVQAREASAFEGTTEEAFRHHLLHQVAYETVLKSQRRLGHAAAAHWLAARVSDRSGEHLATTAMHYLQAGDATQAARWLADAAEYAASRFDNATALAHARSALAAAADDDTALRWRVNLCASRAADFLADRAAQARIADELQALAGLPGSPVDRRARALYVRALLQLRLGQTDECLANVQAAVAAATECGDAEIGAQGNNLWVAVLRTRGNVTQARERAVLGLALARSQGDKLKLAEIRLLLNLSVLDHDAGRYQPALAAMAECLALARRHHQVEIQAILLSNLSAVQLGLGDYATALVWAEEAHAFGLQVGDLMQASIALLNRGIALCGLNRLDEARSSLRPVNEYLESVGARVYLAGGLGALGDVELAAGDAAAAVVCLEAARDAYLTVGQAREALETAAGLSCAWLRRGDLPRALSELAALLRTIEQDAAAADTIEHSPRSPRTYLQMHEVLAAAGEAAAADWLARAHAALMSQADLIGDAALRERYLAQHVDAKAVMCAWRGAAVPP